jgi:Putative transposase
MGRVDGHLPRPRRLPHRLGRTRKSLRPLKLPVARQHYRLCTLANLCRVAHECLIEFLRTSLGLPEGVPGIVMAIHTFGEYRDFHPHLHALVADGLFARSGFLHVMPETGLKPLEELLA